MEKKRYYNIDFLRILLVIFIVYYHLLGYKWVQVYNLDILNDMFHNSRKIGIISNSILFIISGFFLYNSFFKKAETFLTFAYKKLIRFWPALCFAIICIGIMSFFNWVHFDVGGNLLNLCMITKNGSGLATDLTNLNATWFVCWLFWCSLFYFALFKIINNEFKFNFAVSILTYFLLLIWVNNPGKDFLLINSILPRGGILGLSMVGLGVLLHSMSNNIKFNLNFWLATFMEIGLISYFTYGFFFYPFKENFILVIIAGILLTFCFLKSQGFVSKTLNKPFVSFIGKYAFSIYIMQEVTFTILKNSLWKYNTLIIQHPMLAIYTSICLVLLVGIIVYHIIEQPCSNYLKNKLTTIKNSETLAPAERERESNTPA